MTISERRFVETKVQYTEDDLVRLIRQDRGIADNESAVIRFDCDRNGVNGIEVTYAREEAP